MGRQGMPAGLIVETMPLENANDGDGEANGQSRGDTPRSRARRGRRVAPAGKISGRKFQIPDAVFERLQLHAIKKRSNPSAVLTDILDRELPKHKIATEEG
jgi:hypothetical protein